MSSATSESTDKQQRRASGASYDAVNTGFDDGIDLGKLFAQLQRGLGQILGLAMLGTAIGIAGHLILSPRQAVITSTRVFFAFDGLAKGEYPDHSTFQAEDLFAPEIISEALKQQGLENASELEDTIRGGLSIEGIVPPGIIKERDRLRALGTPPPAYIPDEYIITLSLARNFALSLDQRNLLLSKIVSVYREHFQNTYADPPPAFGNVFTALRNADYPDYELILTQEAQRMMTYLTHHLNPEEVAGGRSEPGRSFRSRTTNLSFNDLREQTSFFVQVRLNETLGLIHLNALSRNRSTALVKMGYYLQTLTNQEQKAMEDEKVVQDLLTKAQERTQNYVLGIKAQANQPHAESPVIDQGLIDSLVANDGYNFLLHHALDAGLQVAQVQAEKRQLLEQRQNMESFIQKNTADQSAIIAQADKSLAELEPAYNELITNIRKTQSDFAHQQYGNAIRFSDVISSERAIRPLFYAGVIGLILGILTGMGLSLLGVYVGPKRPA